MQQAADPIQILHHDRLIEAQLLFKIGLVRGIDEACSVEQDVDDVAGNDAQQHKDDDRDPDQSFYENYSCGSERNYTNYCNKEIEKLFDQQSAETDVAKRKKLVWEIDKKLQEDVARPIIFHGRMGSCWQPYVKGITIMVNSSYNGYRYEDVWMDK